MKTAEPPLGSCVPVTDVLTVPTARFRLQFTDDRRTKELRWVLFASSQRGAIGKLIFTLERDHAAHIKSVGVNKAFRGLGLARVLYLATLATLEAKQVRRLYLEAEEDSQRYGRLVGLYQGWGFVEFAGARLGFLYNGTESLRKVPMVSVFKQQTFFPIQLTESTWFGMIALRTPEGSCLVAAEDGSIKVCAQSHGCLWQTLLGAKGEVSLRSGYGKFLCVEADGTIVANRRCNSTWETFQVVPLGGKTVAGRVALRSFHGGYVGIDPVAKRAEVRAHPIPWDGGAITSLSCTPATVHPLVVERMRNHETVALVHDQGATYGELPHARMSVLNACKCVMTLTGEADDDASYVLKYMLATATAVKHDGHPDWLQLVVFLRALGLIFLCWTDDGHAVRQGISAHAWIARLSSGERMPSSIDELERNELNLDHCKSKTSGRKGGNQDDGQLDPLPWTPDEYLYRVLSRNQTTLPREALYVVRFWSFQTWTAQDWVEHGETLEWIVSLKQITCVSDHAVQKVNVGDELPYFTHLAKKYLPEELRWWSLKE